MTVNTPSPAPFVPIADLMERTLSIRHRCGPTVARWLHTVGAVFVTCCPRTIASSGAALEANVRIELNL